MFLRNHPIDRRIRFAKEERIERVQTYRRWATRLVGITLPGIADLVLGSAVRGTLVAGVSVLVIIRIIQPHGILFEPSALPTTEMSTHLLWIGLGVVLWLSSVRRAFVHTKESV